MKYSLCFVTVLVISTFLVVDAKKKPTNNNKFEGDFEFVDEVTFHVVMKCEAIAPVNHYLLENFL